MMHHKLARRMSRPVRDVAMGLVVFSAIVLSGVIGTSNPGSLIASSAHAGLLEEEPVPDVQLGADRQLVALHGIQRPIQQHARQDAMALTSLALAFSLLFALNLWFARHLRQLHARNRRLPPPSPR